MSDHFSGPRALAGPAGDICDFYAFPSPERAGKLVLVMNVHPLAGAEHHFSEAISYNFRLRPVSVGDAGALILGEEAEEVAYSVTFDAAGSGRQTGRVVPSRGAASPFHGGPTPTLGTPVPIEVGDVAGARSDGLRVYAGLRSDPFFIDLAAFQRTLHSGRLAFTEPGTNSLHGGNVLSVVIEVDCAPLLSEGTRPLFAAIAETVVRAGIPIRLERVGRPEVKNVMLQWKHFDRVNGDIELRDLYNLEDPFHLGKDYLGAYRARLDANLAALDLLDGKADWAPDEDGHHPLTELILADYLVVDVSKPYAENTFLEIEKSARGGRPNSTCGGRSLNEPVMHTLYTLLLAADTGPGISDGVAQATVRAGDTFPYLAPANTPLPASPGA
ncbi:DUF4331 family protein [Kribbella sp. NPDC050124]|uniref:DUF4331 family protein n=1 Tax=Kribbella sp. NPDC050124 TaxID=3364114 RepID=UPI0037BDE352